MDKINKEFSQLSGEELFKPITKRLDEKSSATAEKEEEEEEEEELEGPDYRMDEFDRTNPFDHEFRPDDALTPPLSPEPLPGPSTAPLKEQSQPSLEPLKEQLPPSLGPTPEPVKEPPPPYHAFDDYPGETDEKIKNRLSFVKREITKIKNDPNYKKIKTSIYGYAGYDLNSFETEQKKLENVQQYRKYQKSLVAQLQEKKKSLKPVVKQPRKAVSLTPLEKVIMSRRPSVAYSDDDDEQDFPGMGNFRKRYC